jgi:hypothetical protein
MAGGRSVSTLLERFPEMALAGEPPVVAGQVLPAPSHLRVSLGPPALRAAGHSSGRPPGPALG